MQSGEPNRDEAEHSNDRGQDRKWVEARAA
jgi:hypothetical protein